MSQADPSMGTEIPVKARVSPRVAAVSRAGLSRRSFLLAGAAALVPMGLLTQQPLVRFPRAGGPLGALAIAAYEVTYQPIDLAQLVERTVTVFDPEHGPSSVSILIGPREVPPPIEPQVQRARDLAEAAKRWFS